MLNNPDAEVALWAAAVVANGGSVSTARLGIISQLVRRFKSEGVWALTDDIWLLAAENATQGLVSLKQRRTSTVENSPTFTPDRGYVFNGTSNYIDTGFVPTSHCVVATGTSIGLSAYERANVAANGKIVIGATTSGNRQLRLSPCNASGAIIGYANSSAATSTAGVGTSAGLSSLQRSGSAFSIYKNGVSIGLTQPAVIGATNPLTQILIGAAWEVSAPGSFRAASVAFASIEAAMSDAQRLAQYNAVQAWVTAIGGRA